MVNALRKKINVIQLAKHAKALIIISVFHVSKDFKLKMDPAHWLVTLLVQNVMDTVKMIVMNVN
jgi:hypothetical protein